MSEWAKVVTQPMGLAGFALFLVFSCLAKVKKQDELRWLSPVAIVLAAVALIGGLALAYVQTPKPPASAVQPSNTPPPSRQQNNKVQQSSSGNGSPNVQGVQGDVTITMDQSNGKTDTKGKKPAEKPKETSH
jgi:hypothetical protein